VGLQSRRPGCRGPSSETLVSSIGLDPWSWLQLDGWIAHPRSFSHRPGQEALHVEDAFLGEQRVDRAAELRGQDRERLGLAVATGQAAQMLLALGVLAQEEDGGLGEGPLQVDIPDRRFRLSSGLI